MSNQYGAPTALIASYNPATMQTSLSWVAAPEGASTLYGTPGTYIYNIDPTADHVTPIVIGAGSGGCSGPAVDGNGRCGTGGGAGGARAQATFAVSGLSSTETIIVGGGGVGGASQTFTSLTTSNGLAGSAGGTSSFGTLITCTGGGVGTPGTTGSAAAGGTATVVGGTSVTTEAGGSGGIVGLGLGTDVARPGSSTTNAPAGGGGGQGASGDASFALSPFQDAGGNVTNGGTGGTGGAGAFYQTSVAPPIPPPTVGSNGASGMTAPLSGFGGGGGGGGGAAMRNWTDSLIAPAPTGTAIAGNGASGGAPGGGGGGGGMCNMSSFGSFFTGQLTTGAGGPGADGQVYVTQFWLHATSAQYLVFRNGIQIGVTAAGVVSYTDSNPPMGADTYYVIASSDGVTPQSPTSNPATVFVTGSGNLSPGNYPPLGGKKLPSKPGLSSGTVLAIPDNWSKAWYRSHINNVLSNADTRNAISGPGISITGNITQPATISLAGLGPANPNFSSGEVLFSSAAGSTNPGSQPATGIQASPNFQYGDAMPIPYTAAGTTRGPAIVLGAGGSGGTAGFAALEAGQAQDGTTAGNALDIYAGYTQGIGTANGGQLLLAGGGSFGGTGGNVVLEPGPSTTGSPGVVRIASSSGASLIDFQNTGAINVAGSGVGTAGQVLTSGGAGAPTTWTTTSGGGGATTKIAEQILSAPAATVTFSSIPATFRTLILRVTLAASVNTSPIFALTLNGDVAAHYQGTVFFGGTSSGANNEFTQTSMQWNGFVGANTLANSPATGTFVFHNYTGTVFNKVVSGHWHRMDALGTSFSGVVSGGWSSNAAITSIALFMSSGNFVTGSTFSLYGES